MDKNILKKLVRIKDNINPRSLALSFGVLLLLAALFYTGTVIYNAGFFKISEVRSNVNLEPFIKNYIKGKSLISLDIKKVYKTITRMHPEYKDVKIVKEFPSSLRVDVSLRKPAVQLHTTNFYLLDREGVVISMSESNRFPGTTLIEMENSNVVFQVGAPVKEQRLLLAFKLINEIKEQKFLSKFSIKTINVTFPDACYFTINNTHVIIGSDDFKRKLYILENLLNEKLNGNIFSVEYIDLRHKKAYVGYAQ
ncbi:MAG: cell division protein FtsQ/DivIB [Candidatus Omnitrophota bacterium]